MAGLEVGWYPKKEILYASVSPAIAQHSHCTAWALLGMVRKLPLYAGSWVGVHSVRNDPWPLQLLEGGPMFPGENCHCRRSGWGDEQWRKCWGASVAPQNKTASISAFSSKLLHKQIQQPWIAYGPGSHVICSWTSMPLIVIYGNTTHSSLLNHSPSAACMTSTQQNSPIPITLLAWIN